MNIEQARFNMIEQQIRPWDVLESSVLKLLSVVKRELFVPDAHKSLAFVDMEIPLSSPSERAMQLGQCMLAPRVEARMLQDLALSSTDKVLEIGTGSGYMAALLAHCCQRVVSLEIDADLVNSAKLNLNKAGISNVEVRLADGSQGLPLHAPFDAIVLSGSVAEVPHQLLQQLKIGGRLMAIAGDAPVMCATLITRTGEAHYRTLQAWDTVAPRLQNFPEHSRFVF
jgi:protein-L-isoaspartate(D-aspartate) O-methyltransferase